MAVSGSDVPGRYDLVLDVGGTKTGFVFDETIDPQARLFGKKKASYSYSPTFVERQNVQGNYGDDSQAFWLTASQNDWSGGEGQKFFRASDDVSRTSYWRGTNVELAIPGQVKLGPATISLTFAAAANSVCYGGANFFVGSTTNLYEVDNAGGTITDRGAHGAGGNATALAYDGLYLYISGAATTKIRKYNTSAHTFADFSTVAGARSLTYLNNTLYGIDDLGRLCRYDTAGARTTLFTWQDAIGGTIGGDREIFPFGGKLGILNRQSGVPLGPELLIYDGVGVLRLAEFSANFLANYAVVSQGVIFIVGLGQKRGTGTRTEIRYVANGTPGLAYASQYSSTASTGTLRAVAAFSNGVLFTDPINSALMYYDLSDGAVSTVGSYTPSGDGYMAAANTSAVHVQSATTGNTFMFDTAFASSGTVTSSLFDFDSSLDKLFRGIKVDFDSATDGNGGSVDIAYRVGDVDGSYTTLQTGAASGTEYPLTGVTGRNISVKITLNKGTSTSGPTLKRVYARAAPVLNRYRLAQYTLSCFGDPSDQNAIQRLRDGTPNPKTGREMANALASAITSTTPITVYDRFNPNGYTAVLEPSQCEVIEIHAEPRIPPVKSGSFVAIITAREV